MSSLLQLVIRRWRVAIMAHLAVMLISVAVLLGWLLYWGYVEASGQAASARVILPAEPADLILASSTSSRQIRVPDYYEKVYSYRQLRADTAYGRLRLGVVTEQHTDAMLPLPQDASIWAKQSLADQWQLQVGDNMSLRLMQEHALLELTAHLGGIYADSVFLPDLLADGKWSALQQISLPASETLFYNLTPGGGTLAEQQNSLWLTGLPEGVCRIDGVSMVAAGKKLATDALRSSNIATMMLFAFLTLGTGTFCLLIYLDSRRELAVLKSLGLRPRETVALFWLENLLTAMLGWMIAATLAQPLAAHLTIPVIITSAAFQRSLLWLLGAVMLATALPCLFGNRANIIDLLFNRTVSIFRINRRGLSRYYPNLETLLAAGYSCIKLPNPYGQFDGICLRQPGQQVKQGETVAWESLAWGLGERHYLAACDGTVMQCDMTQGLIVIEPRQAECVDGSYSSN